MQQNDSQISEISLPVKKYVWSDNDASKFFWKVTDKQTDWMEMIIGMTLEVQWDLFIRTLKGLQNLVLITKAFLNWNYLLNI